MSGSDQRWVYGDIERLARRVGWWAEGVLEAQRVGAGHGDRDEPWTPAFQRDAVRICFRTLSVDYQMVTAAVFGRGVELMDNCAESRALAEWDIVCSYLSAVSDSIVDECLRRGVAQRGTKGHRQLSERPPVAIRFDLLATLALPAGVAALSQAAATVTAVCHSSRLGVSDQERSWLEALARGDKVVEVAAAHDMSDRTMYRELNQLWAKLGVENRSQGLALAAKLSLVAEREGDTGD